MPLSRFYRPVLFPSMYLLVFVVVSLLLLLLLLPGNKLGKLGKERYG